MIKNITAEQLADMRAVYEKMYDTLLDKDILVNFSNKTGKEDGTLKYAILLGAYHSKIGNTRFICENLDKYQTNAKLTFIYRNKVSNKKMEILNDSVNDFIIAINFSGNESDDHNLGVAINDTALTFFDDKYKIYGIGEEIV